LYKRFGTTLLEVLSESRRSTQAFCKRVKDLIKYTTLDCLTINPKIGSFV